MKVLLAPINFAAQVMTLTEELRENGIEATFLQFGYGNPALGYRTDRYIRIENSRSRLRTQIRVLEQCLTEGYDIFNLWARSLIFGSAKKNEDMGLDLPFIKQRGIKIIHRFTGYDLRELGRHAEINPYSPMRYGYECPHDPVFRQQYVDMLKEYVDQFVVQDAEMHAYFPEARVIPRSLNLKEWEYVGVTETRRPLVIHAPTNADVKGTSLIMAVLEKLRDEGLIEYRLIQGMNHYEAREVYKQADIAIDQILIGWYGVFALECMALGKPVVVYILDDLYKQNPLPVVNANPDNLEDRLRTLVGDWDLRQELALQGRKHVEDVHDVKKVALQWIDLYKEVLGRPYRVPDTVEGTSFLLNRLADQSGELARLRRERVALPDSVVRAVLAFRELRRRPRYNLARLMRR